MSERPMVENCASCRFSLSGRKKPDEVRAVLLCRRYPPALVVGMRPVFPPVESTWWCGEFESFLVSVVAARPTT